MSQDKIKKTALIIVAIFVVICVVAVVIKANSTSETETDATETLTEEVSTEETGDEATEEEQDSSTSSSTGSTTSGTLSDLQEESELLASLDWFDGTHDWRELDLSTVISTFRSYSWFNADTQTMLTIRYYRIDDYDLVNDLTDWYAYSVIEAWYDRDLGVTVASLYINDYEESNTSDPDIAETITIVISPTEDDDDGNTTASLFRLDVEYSGALSFAADTYYSIERAI